MTCHELTKLLERERPCIKHEIDIDKWYLSEHEGHDVGTEVAEKHFLTHYLQPWAEGFKECYCNYVCEYKECDHRIK